MDDQRLKEIEQSFEMLGIDCNTHDNFSMPYYNIKQPIKQTFFKDNVPIAYSNTTNWRNE